MQSIVVLCCFVLVFVSPTYYLAVNNEQTHKLRADLSDLSDRSKLENTDFKHIYLQCQGSLLEQLSIGE